MGAVPTHEQLENDVNVPFNGNTMLHVSNHIDHKPSGHWILRQLLIELIETTNPKLDKLDYQLGQLPPDLLSELHGIVIELHINFWWSWNINDIKTKYNECLQNAPTNEESRRKWLIERKYLWFWFHKVATLLDDTYCVLPVKKTDNMFITDGQRIASLLRQNYAICHKRCN